MDFLEGAKQIPIYRDREGRLLGFMSVGTALIQGYQMLDNNIEIVHHYDKNLLGGQGYVPWDDLMFANIFGETIHLDELAESRNSAVDRLIEDGCLAIDPPSSFVMSDADCDCEVCQQREHLDTLSLLTEVEKEYGDSNEDQIQSWLEKVYDLLEIDCEYENEECPIGIFSRSANFEQEILKDRFVVERQGYRDRKIVVRKSIRKQRRGRMR